MSAPLRLPSVMLTCLLPLLVACGNDKDSGDSSVSLAGSFFHDDAHSGERTSVEGRADLTVVDDSGASVYHESATTLVDGSWRLNAAPRCETCVYSLKVDFPADYYPDPVSVRFFYGEELSFEEFESLSITGLHLSMIHSESGTAYFRHTGTAGLSDFPLSPGDEIYEVAVRVPGWDQPGIEAQCTYVYWDFYFSIAYFDNGRPYSDADGDAVEVYKDGDAFDCMATLDDPFLVGFQSEHVSAEGMLSGDWDSLLVLYQEGDSEGEYQLLSGPSYYVDEEFVEGAM